MDIKRFLMDFQGWKQHSNREWIKKHINKRAILIL